MLRALSKVIYSIIESKYGSEVPRKKQDSSGKKGKKPKIDEKKMKKKRKQKKSDEDSDEEDNESDFQVDNSFVSDDSRCA
jgi:hypothetical protein